MTSGGLPFRSSPAGTRPTDFDKVVGDPGNRDLINPIYDLADHIHPNPLGYFVMGKSIDLSLFDDRHDRGDRDDDD